MWHKRHAYHSDTTLLFHKRLCTFHLGINPFDFSLLAFPVRTRSQRRCPSSAFYCWSFNEPAAVT